MPSVLCRSDHLPALLPLVDLFGNVQGLLRVVPVLGTLENPEVDADAATQAPFWKHALDRMLNYPLWDALHGQEGGGSQEGGQECIAGWPCWSGTDLPGQQVT